MSRYWRVALLVAAVAVLAVVVWRATLPPQVTVAPVRRGNLVEALSATGVVEAAQTHVASKVLGRIAALLADEGDAVGQGQTLARLDATELRAQLSEREAARRAAQAEVARIEAGLAQERAASRARIERGRAAEAAALARLEELRAGPRPQEIERARQAVAAARAQEENAAADYDRVSRLLAQGAIARADADAARARLDASRAALRAAEEELALVEEGARSEQIAAAQAQWQAARAESAVARAAAGQIAVLERSLQAARAVAEQAQAAVAGARSMLAEAEITAPISGWVGRRYLEVGDLAGPGTPLFLISDNDRLWVTAEVDEEDLALVRRGQRVEVTAEALSEPLPGTVVEVGAVAVPRGLEQVRAKIIRCKVVLERGRELLKPGMEVDVSARTTLARQVLLAPNDAVVESEGKTFVRLVTDDTVRRREVTLGRSNYQEAEVAAGLREGDLVVVAGGEDLRDGQRVAVRREQGDGG